MYTTKWENLDELDTFLETHKLQKVTRANTENLNRPVTGKDLKSRTKTSQQRQAQDQMISPKEARTLNSFHKASMTLISKPKIPQEH